MLYSSKNQQDQTARDKDFFSDMNLRFSLRPLGFGGAAQGYILEVGRPMLDCLLL